jgi:hypothetical protein
MNNDDIVTYCKRFSPHLIYIAIGCSQAFHEPGSAMAAPQGYPPFLKSMGTRQLCILIDPLLEDPPRPCSEYATSPGQQVIVVGETHFIPVRRNFEWTCRLSCPQRGRLLEQPVGPGDARRSTEDTAFIHTLCAYTLEKPRTRMIVQDYSGEEIQRYYPIQTFGKELIRKVLFDFTYQNGGCFVDLSKVNILFCDDSFSFMQPLYERLTYVFKYLTAEQKKFLLNSRHNIFYSFVKRLHKIQEGVEEIRDWCTPQIVMDMIPSFCVNYSTPYSTDQQALEELLLAYLTDLCLTSDTQLSQEEIVECVRSPTNMYQDTLSLLKGILLDS